VSHHLKKWGLGGGDRFVSIFFFPMMVFYILKAKHLLFVTVVEGTAGRTLAPLLGAAAAMMLCACLMFVL
jgi:hypothetical protein